MKYPEAILSRQIDFQITLKHYRDFCRLLVFSFELEIETLYSIYLMT
jgi:hypothetical protein